MSRRHWRQSCSRERTSELQAELQILLRTVRTGTAGQAGKSLPLLPGTLRLHHVSKAECSRTFPAEGASSTQPAGEAGSNAQSYMRCFGFIFAVSPTGNPAIAYDPTTRWTGSLEWHATKEHPLRVSFVATAESFNRSGIVALRIEGEQITRIAAFDIKSRTWRPQDLERALSRAAHFPNLRNTVAYDLGRHLYTFKQEFPVAWDHLDVGASGCQPRTGTKVNAAR